MYPTVINKEFVEKYKNKQPPWGSLGYVTYKRTYARKLTDITREEFWQTLERCCNGILEIGGAFTQEEIQELYHYMFNFKGIVSGRALWQLGTETVRKVGADSLCNCWGVSNDTPIDSFKFAMDQLMLGGGVGFTISNENVYQLPIIKYKPTIIRVDDPDCDYIIPDNREGWVTFLGKVLKSYFFTGRRLNYYTKCIRDRGRPIAGFGGVASGPEDLVKGINQICLILNNRFGKKLRPIDVLDINNILGQIVVAGNVRRSAELILGEGLDNTFLNAKNWKLGKIPAWRSMSNNSILAKTYESIPEKFWDGYNGDGEAYGLVNLNNFRRFGRLIDGEGYRPDEKIVTTNPCSEIGLESYECCNLAEIYLPNIKNLDEFKRVSQLLYMVQKTISNMKYSWKQTQEVVDRNHRLGLGITGYLQSDFIDDSSSFDHIYRSLEQYDSYYSELIGCKESIKITTVKPSGTLSLLPGVTPGMHPAYSAFYMRTIRFSSNDPIIEMCRKCGYKIEPLLQLDGSVNYDTSVIYFPVKSADAAITNSDLTAIDQLEHLKFLQTWWSDNSVSVTIYYKKYELPLIKNWLAENFDDCIKSVSFLLHSEHGFRQAPFQEINAEEYYMELDKITPLGTIGEGTLENLECSGGICPIK